MMRWLSALSLLFFINCAGMHKKYDVAIFGVFIEKFEQYSVIYGNRQIIVTNLIIEFGDLKDEIVGLCTKYENRSPLITLDREWWQDPKRNDTEREILMFHELGHCVLDRDHNDNILPNGKKESIMYYRVINGNDYITNRGYYLKELFYGEQNYIERTDTCN